MNKLNHFFYWSLTIFISFNFSLRANNITSFCQLEDLQKTPTLQDGRVKPLESYARDVEKFLFEKKSYHLKLDLHSSTEFYCLLSLAPQEKTLSWLKKDLWVNLHHEKTRDLLKNTHDGKNALSYFQLQIQADQIRSALMREREEGSYKKELQNLLSKANLIQTILAKENWMVFHEGDFKNISELDPLNQEDLIASTQIYQDKNPDDFYLLELTYIKLNLYSWALLLTLMAILTLAFSRRENYLGWSLSILTLTLQITATTMRILISNRAPITNMYETVMFSGMGCLLLVTFIAFFKKDRRFLLAGLVYNFSTLLMIRFANNMLSSSIKPLVPVLRDNFWLSTHVTTVILSYSAFAMSWPLANWVIIRLAQGKLTKDQLADYNGLLYTSLKWGTVLLSAGVILGGVWADYSWGRFWGWDPKETWSLIVLLCYMVILHGKSTQWITKRAFPFLVAFAFLSVIFAWFGVNYILASGLHSYGFSEGGAIFILSIFMVQIIIGLWCYWQTKKR